MSARLRAVREQGAAPGDLLLLCGIVGVADEDVERTVHAVPELLAPGGTVLWTRHRSAGPDPGGPGVARAGRDGVLQGPAVRWGAAPAVHVRPAAAGLTYLVSLA